MQLKDNTHLQAVKCYVTFLSVKSVNRILIISTVSLYPILSLKLNSYILVLLIKSSLVF
jgi:hypothetical protein